MHYTLYTIHCGDRSKHNIHIISIGIRKSDSFLIYAMCNVHTYVWLTMSHKLMFHKMWQHVKSVQFDQKKNVHKQKIIRIFHVKIFNTKPHDATSCTHIFLCRNDKNANSNKNLQKMNFEWLILNMFLVPGIRWDEKKNKQFSILSLLMFNRMAFPLIEFDSICRMAMFFLRFVFMFVNKFLCEFICNVKLTTNYSMFIV